MQSFFRPGWGFPPPDQCFSDFAWAGGSPGGETRLDSPGETDTRLRLLGNSRNRQRGRTGPRSPCVLWEERVVTEPISCGALCGIQGQGILLRCGPLITNQKLGSRHLQRPRLPVQGWEFSHTFRVKPRSFYLQNCWSLANARRDFFVASTATSVRTYKIYSNYSEVTKGFGLAGAVERRRDPPL